MGNMRACLSWHCARHHARQDWCSYEAAVIKSASFEVAESEAYFSMLSQCKQGLDDAVLCEAMKSLPNWTRNFRPGATRELCDILKDFIVQRVNYYTQGEGARIAAGPERIRHLRSYCTFLGEFDFPEWHNLKDWMCLAPTPLVASAFATATRPLRSKHYSRMRLCGRNCRCRTLALPESSCCTDCLATSQPACIILRRLE